MIDLKVRGEGVHLFFVCCLFFTVFITSCAKHNGSGDIVQIPVFNEMIFPDSIKVLTFKNETDGYGYDVLVNNKLVVHQPHKPGVAGDLGFDVEIQAQQVGMLVASKLMQKILPPSVTRVELDSVLNLVPEKK